MRVTVLRHVAFEGLGLLDPLLRERGAAIEVIDVPTADVPALSPLEPDLLVVLGGPIGVNDAAAFPFLEPELALVRERLAAQRPTLGICLGAQLMAAALGAGVAPAPRKEIGWAPVHLTAAGAAGCLGELGADDPVVLHWHGDNHELPDGAERLAWTEACPNQAFSIGRHALGLQFHLEVDAAMLERWFVGHVVEIGATPGVDVPGLRTDTACHAPALAEPATRVFRSWLDALPT